jgi:MYXO-CTERM domain-containing protein
MTREADLADRGGCSVAPTRGSWGATSVVGLATLALVVRRRRRTGARPSSLKGA